MAAALAGLYQAKALQGPGLSSYLRTALQFPQPSLILGNLINDHTCFLLGPGTPSAAIQPIRVGPGNDAIYHPLGISRGALGSDPQLCLNLSALGGGPCPHTDWTSLSLLVPHQHSRVPPTPAWHHFLCQAVP